MNKQEKIQNEIDKTLDLFDKKKSLPTNLYFYTRLQQRINENSRKQFSIFGVLKPAFFTILIVINISTAIWYKNSSDITNSTEIELIDILKSDFNLNDDQTQSSIFE